MKTNAFTFGLVGLFLGGAVVWLFTATENISQVRVDSSDRLDAHFIEHMIPHHEDAITMADLALEKSHREEIRQLAQDIIASQSAENEQMRQWYQDWFGREVSTGEHSAAHHGMMGAGRGMHMGMMGSEADILRLEEAADFDRAFIEDMIVHHQMAVMMATMLKQGTQREEMRQLADDIIVAQTDEVEQMRQWYNAWF